MDDCNLCFLIEAPIHLMLLFQGAPSQEHRPIRPPSPPNDIFDRDTRSATATYASATCRNSRLNMTCGTVQLLASG
jgi:hypothetical protein